MSTKNNDELLSKWVSRDLEVLEELTRKRLPNYRMMNTGKFYSWPKLTKIILSGERSQRVLKKTYKQH